jgi:uncharacterized membrane protein YgcG
MEQQRRPRRWAFALGAASAAILLAAAGVFVAVSTSLPDQAGEPVGVTGVTVGNVAGTTPTGTPTPTVTPTPTLSPTGAVTVPDPTPVPADDHGGDNGKSGKGGSGGSGGSGSGGHGSDD